MDTKQKIIVMQAYLEGKPIEVRLSSHTGWLQWRRDTLGSEPGWNWEKNEYRVAAHVVRYRCYVCETKNNPDSPAVRTCNLIYEVAGGGGKAEKYVEALPGFIRWIDTEWQTP